MSASSQWSNLLAAFNARLNNQNGAWEPSIKNTNEWLQVDLVTQHSVTRVATQGRHDRSHWVSKYQLQYSNDGSNFQFYRERGQNVNKVRHYTKSLAHEVCFDVSNVLIFVCSQLSLKQVPPVTAPCVCLREVFAL